MLRRIPRFLRFTVLIAVLLAISVSVFQSWSSGTPGTGGWVQTRWGPLGPADRDFLAKIRMAGLWEGPTGQQAMQQASTPEVREVGRILSTEHAALDEELRRVADQLGVLLPTSPSAQQLAWMSDISSRTGSDYDRTFIQRLREAHGMVLPVVAEIRVSTRNDLIRTFAGTADRFVTGHIQHLEGSGLVDFANLPDSPAPGLLSGERTVQDLIVPILIFVASLLGALALGFALRRRSTDRPRRRDVAKATKATKATKAAPADAEARGPGRRAGRGGPARPRGGAPDAPAAARRHRTDPRGGARDGGAQAPAGRDDGADPPGAPHRAGRVDRAAASGAGDAGRRTRPVDGAAPPGPAGPERARRDDRTPPPRARRVRRTHRDHRTAALGPPLAPRPRPSGVRSPQPRRPDGGHPATAESPLPDPERNPDVPDPSRAPHRDPPRHPDRGRHRATAQVPPQAGDRRRRDLRGHRPDGLRRRLRPAGPAAVRTGHRLERPGRAGTPATRPGSSRSATPSTRPRPTSRRTRTRARAPVAPAAPGPPSRPRRRPPRPPRRRAPTGAPKPDAPNNGLDVLGRDCKGSDLEPHKGFQTAPACVSTAFGEVADEDKSPSLLITEAPRVVRTAAPFTISVSTRNLVRDRFLGAAAGGYYLESSFLNEDGLQRGHFHTACRMLERTDSAPDSGPPPAFFLATQDKGGSAEPDTVTITVTGLPTAGTAQCAVWAGDGSHRVPMMQRANQTPAFDAVRISVR